MNYMNQYRHLQTFTTLKEFDQHRSKIFYAIKSKLSKGALAVWNLLSQRSIEVPGVCWIKIDTIAKATGLSRSTVERAIRLFKKLGVIRVEETTRPENGGDGANVYIFQKLGEGAEMTGRSNSGNSCASKDEQPESAGESKVFKANKTYLNHSNVIVPGVPKNLQYFKAIFGQHLRTLWFRVNFAFKKLKIEVDKETREDIGRTTLEALKQYVMNNKGLSEDEQNKLAYRIAFNQLQQRKERGEIVDLTDFWSGAIIAEPTPAHRLETATASELDALGVY